MKWLVKYPDNRIVHFGEMHLRHLATDVTYEEVYQWILKRGFAVIAEQGSNARFMALRSGNRVVDPWGANRWPRRSKADKARRFDLYEYLADSQWEPLNE